MSSVLFGSTCRTMTVYIKRKHLSPTWGARMDAEKLRFVTSFIEYPEETALTEYKSAVCFELRSDFGAKLVKHIFGQANVGGGYIVIGFQEDANGKLRPDPALIEEVSRSYETTRLSQSVDAILGGGQRIELLVHKISFNGKVYPVISVQGFKTSPYFCGRDYVAADGTTILKQGAVYVRDEVAKTVVISLGRTAGIRFLNMQSPSSMKTS